MHSISFTILAIFVFTVYFCHQTIAEELVQPSAVSTNNYDEFSEPNIPVSTRPPIVPDGFAVKLFAHEPVVHNPCAMCFDAKGRLTVSHGPQYRNPDPDTRGDQVLILIDKNDDGVADGSRVFAEGFNGIQGLAWNGDQLWVANSPELTMVRDTDGDEVADEYVRVYTDLGNIEHALHGLNWAPDGKLYMSKGNSKGHNRPEEDGRVAPQPFRELFGLADPEGAPDFPDPVSFTASEYYKNGKGYHDPSDDWGRQGGVLRCDAMGKNLEIVSRGFRNPWDIAFDSGFRWLGTDNDQDQGDKIFDPFFGSHFGWGHAWSYDWYGKDHTPTVPPAAPLFEGSGTGVVYYSGTQFPEHYRNAFFINDWLSKRTYIFRTKWEGALRQPRNIESPLEEFAVEDTHGLFKPTDIEVGPDGALYINCWGVEYGAQWEHGVENGVQVNEGRIYRIWYADRPIAKRSEWYQPKRDVQITTWTLDQLTEDFAPQSLPIWRVNAQNELVRRGRIVSEFLLAKLRNKTLSESEETWIAWTLGQINDGESNEAFVSFAKDEKQRLNLRLQSLRILAHRSKSGWSDGMPVGVVGSLSDPEARIRFEAVQSIWQAHDRKHLDALLERANQETDRITFYSLWNAIRDLATIDERKQFLNDERSGVRFAALLGLMDSFQISKQEVLKRVENDADSRIQKWGLKWVLAGSPPRTVSNQKERVGSKDELRIDEVLGQLETTNNDRVRTGLLKLLSGNQLSGERWDRVHATYNARAESNESVNTEVLVSLLGALSFDKRSIPTLWDHLSHPDNAVHHAAIDGLAENQQGRSFLLEKLATNLNARQKMGAVTALSRELDDIHSWRLDASSIASLEMIYKSSRDTVTRSKVLSVLTNADFNEGDEIFRNRIFEVAQLAASDPDPRVYTLAPTLAARIGSTVSIPERSTATVEEILPLLTTADATRGESVFFDRQRASCDQCHQVGGRGTNFAPSLSDIGQRSNPKEILESILHPSNKITEGFAVTNLITEQGLTLSGVVKSETSTTLQLFQEDGRTIEVAKSDVEDRILSKTSIMPSTFGLLLSKQEIADIVAWLMTKKQKEFTPQNSLTRKLNEQRDRTIEFTPRREQVIVTANGQPLATYYFRDATITRPYFAHVHAPGGIHVTRNHPPKPGDPSDHGEFHPGLFLAFGDISGHDYWRLKAKVVHDGFLQEPTAQGNEGSFQVLNRYLSTDGEKAICVEECSFKFTARPNMYVIDWESVFRSPDGDFYFGDQEEMGLGVRVASAIREAGGNGRIISSGNQIGAEQTWGKAAAWCDYSGKIFDHVGVTIMASANNVRPSWWHNRDYGLMVANLFGREAMQQGPKSKIVVKQGASLRLRYRILLHADAKELNREALAAEYELYVDGAGD